MQSLEHPRERAAVLDTNSDVFFEILFGAAKARRVLVPLNNRLAPAEMVDIINDAGVGLLFVGPEFLPVAEALRPSCPGVRQVVTLGGHHAGMRTTRGGGIVRPRRIPTFRSVGPRSSSLFTPAAPLGDPRGPS